MAGLAAKGTALYKGGPSPTAYTKIGKVKSISGPGFQVDFVDTTTHDTAGNFREFAAVLCSAGDISFTVNFDPSDSVLDFSTGLYNDMQSLTRVHWKLKFPPSDTLGTTLEFYGYVSQHPMTFNVDGIVEATIGIKIDGAITFGTEGA